MTTDPDSVSRRDVLTLTVSAGVLHRLIPTQFLTSPVSLSSASPEYTRWTPPPETLSAESLGVSAYTTQSMQEFYQASLFTDTDDPLLALGGLSSSVVDQMLGLAVDLRKDVVTLLRGRFDPAEIRAVFRENNVEQIGTTQDATLYRSTTEQEPQVFSVTPHTIIQTVPYQEQTAESIARTLHTTARTPAQRLYRRDDAFATLVNGLGTAPVAIASTAGRFPGSVAGPGVALTAPYRHLNQPTGEVVHYLFAFVYPTADAITATRRDELKAVFEEATAYQNQTVTQQGHLLAFESDISLDELPDIDLIP